MHTPESLETAARIEFKRRYGRDAPEDDVSSSDAFGAAFVAMTLIGTVWAIYSVAVAAKSLFSWLVSSGYFPVLVGVVGVVALGLLGFWLFARKPRLFGAMEVALGACVAGYFCYRLSLPAAAVLEQVANLVGTVYLVVDGMKAVFAKRSDA